MVAVTNFLKQNTVWVISMVCLAAVTYYKVEQFDAKFIGLEEDYKERISLVQLELISVEERLGKKIKIINDNTKELQKIAIKVAILETTECK
tara:strand:+ start:5440 stop:5715 length:276 start_codon:yes stop_codon:yes gene_type:complete